MGGGNIYLRMLKRLRKKGEPLNEANTSMHVLEILKKCLRWEQNLIKAQKSGHGFIDYELEFPDKTARVYVEVKALGKPLRDEQITKYLEHIEDLTIGALTNFEEWWVYLAGHRVKAFTGNNVARIIGIRIDCRDDITLLQRYLGYSRTRTETRLFATLGEVPSVVAKFVCKDRAVLRAIRTTLQNIREDGNMAIPVPQFVRLGSYVQKVLAGESIDGCPFSEAKLRKAIGHRDVAVMITHKLEQALGARRQIGTVHSTIRQMLWDAKNCNDRSSYLRIANQG